MCTVVCVRELLEITENKWTILWIITVATLHLTQTGTYRNMPTKYDAEGLAELTNHGQIINSLKDTRTINTDTHTRYQQGANSREFHGGSLLV